MELTQSLAEYFAGRREVVAAYLFGSRAEGVARRDSDADVAVLLDESVQGSFDYRMRMADELERLLKTSVDLVVLRNAPLLLQYQILKRGRIVFERDVDRRAVYQMRVMGRYYDYKRFFDFHSKHLRETIKQRGLGYGPSGN
ncbi:MAG: nucleotidyltransferase domain-containing protein [Bacillota bacterium]